MEQKRTIVTVLLFFTRPDKVALSDEVTFEKKKLMKRGGIRYTQIFEGPAPGSRTSSRFKYETLS